MKKKMLLSLLALGLVVLIGITWGIVYAAGSNKNGDNDSFCLVGTLDGGKTYIYTDNGGKTWMSQEEYYAINPDAEQGCEFWEIDEFETWMEAEHEVNQKLADNGDVLFYEKDENDVYVSRAWTQEDVDALYEKWQEQLDRMKQGYRFTKPMTLSDGGMLVGEFVPETGHASKSPGSTIITFQNGSTEDLGHFNTAEEAARAVEIYLNQQVENGTITQQEADNILANTSIE